ncbi:MAG: thymidine phosphorylase [Bdellovibrionota bacterium]
MLLPQEIIRKKRDGLPLSNEELRDFFDGYQRNEIQDYQISALLMAIFFNGMQDHEIAYLTKLTRDSGKVFSWNYPKNAIVDKHSTGGVGDKTSLIILPLCLLEGLKVPMIAGRGLGHTGGTVDKLESIPGINLALDIASSEKQMTTFGGFFLGQTNEIAALDKKLYALRDVTATIESIPLIVVSILAKKLAEGIGSLVMDIKFGNGAFMAEKEHARNLASKLIEIGKLMNLPMRAVISNMNSPLGRAAGNAVEVWECLEVMRGRGPSDTETLSVELAAHMVQMADPSRELAVIKENMQTSLRNGSCYEKFCQIISAQNGEIKYFSDEKFFNSASIIKPVYADKEGVVAGIDVRKLGTSIVKLGGGRKLITDSINHNVGLIQMKKIGEPVNCKEPLLFVLASSEDDFRECKQTVLESYHIDDKVLEEECLIDDVMMF